MALFFDSEWFDARLTHAGLKRADVAAALGLSEAEITALWKDQREVRAQDVRLLAALLGATPEEIASRAGISTPVPRDAGSDLVARIVRLERELALLRAELRALGERRS
jgi:transcriptional regulator with XRE-family HTH domain